MERTRRRIPEATVARLPVYLRSLLELAEEKTPTISSERLAEMAGVNAAKVRKDLSYLGSYGTRGVGYDVEYLLFQMSRELGLTHDWPVVIVGIGNLGAALANYGGFGDRGFPVAALVDADTSKVGRKVGPLAIRHIDDLPELVEELGAAIGIIATPASVAQDVADRLTEAGVTSILNFAPAVISVPSDSSLRKVDLALELQVLSFYRQRTALDTAEVAEAAKRGRPVDPKASIGAKRGGVAKAGGGRKSPAAKSSTSKSPTPKSSAPKSSAAKSSAAKSNGGGAQGRSARSAKTGAGTG